MTNIPHLTPKQRRILAFIKKRINKGCPPTVREIAAEFDIGTPNGALHHVIALEEKGAITRERGARNIRLVHPDANARLLAAAPDLLEACKAALRYDASVLGRAAGGEVDLLKDGGGLASGDDLDELYYDWQLKSKDAVANATKENDDE